MSLCCGINLQDILTKHRDAAVVATIELPPINGAGGRFCLVRIMDSHYKHQHLLVIVKAAGF